MNVQHGRYSSSADIVTLDPWRLMPSWHPNDQKTGYMPHVALLLLVRAELLLVAPVMATVCCLANLLEADETGDMEPGVLTHFAPMFSDAFGHALDDMRRDPCLFGLVQLWQQLDGQLHLAKALTRALTSSAPISHRPAVDKEAVGDSWRRTAHLCLSLYAKTIAKLQAEGVTSDSMSERSTIGLLNNAAGGGTNCLDAEGLISIPARAERRVAQRVALAVPTRIHIRNIVIPGIVVNASTSGLGLQVETPIRAGQTLTVELPEGRNLAGYVVWSVGCRFGLKLNSKLSVTDSLFVGP